MCLLASFLITVSEVVFPLYGISSYTDTANHHIARSTEVVVNERRMIELEVAIDEKQPVVAGL